MMLIFLAELIVYPCSGGRRRCRCQPFPNMNISETSRPITIKLYLKHHWGGGKAAWGFGADQFRTLVSMATDSSHRVIMGKTFSRMFLIGSFSYLQVTMTCMRAWMSSTYLSMHFLVTHIEFYLSIHFLVTNIDFYLSMHFLVTNIDFYLSMHFLVTDIVFTCLYIF